MDAPLPQGTWLDQVKHRRVMGELSQLSGNLVDEIIRLEAEVELWKGRLNSGGFVAVTNEWRGDLDKPVGRQR